MGIARIVSKGEKFGKLTVIKEIKQKNKCRRFLFKCECGSVKEIKLRNVVYGFTKSCGCIVSGRMPEYHGMSNTKEHNAWGAMKQRCSNPKVRMYKRYGGRGITYDPKWETFEGFYEDMGPCPDGLSLDRIDNNKGYCKENCRWATQDEQHKNREITVYITKDGKKQTIKEWSEELGLKKSTIRSRYHKYGDNPKVLDTKIKRQYYQGKPMTYWARKHNLHPKRVYSRLGRGRSVEEALDIKKRLC